MEIAETPRTKKRLLGPNSLAFRIAMHLIADHLKTLDIQRIILMHCLESLQHVSERVGLDQQPQPGKLVQNPPPT